MSALLVCLLLGGDWTTAPWTQNDASIRSIRLGLDRIANAPGRPGVERIRGLTPEMHRYQAAWKKTKSQNRLFGFLYAQACVRSINPDAKTPLATHEAQKAMVGTPTDDVEWVRLRYIVRSQEAIQPGDTSVGERLWSKFPGDREIGLVLARQYVYGMQDAGFRRAFVLLDDLVARYPDRIGVAGDSGQLRYLAAVKAKNWEWLKKADVELARYERLAPKDAPGREMSGFERADIRRLLKRGRWGFQE